MPVRALPSARFNLTACLLPAPMLVDHSAPYGPLLPELTRVTPLKSFDFPPGIGFLPRAPGVCFLRSLEAPRLRPSGIGPLLSRLGLSADRRELLPRIWKRDLGSSSYALIASRRCWSLSDLVPGVLLRLQHFCTVIFGTCSWYSSRRPTSARLVRVTVSLLYPYCGAVPPRLPPPLRAYGSGYPDTTLIGDMVFMRPFVT